MQEESKQNGHVNHETTENGVSKTNGHNGEIKENGTNVDMRHTLTQWERDSVIRLKEACEKDGIEYRHIFELAKYVLVVKSMVDDKDPEVDEKRLQLALKRMRKKRSWEKYHGLHVVKDKHAALQEFEAACPGYHVTRYRRDVDGRRCIGCHHAFAPTTYIHAKKENMQKFLVVEHWALDIAAYDMEEARRGIACFSISEDKLTPTRSVLYLRFLFTAKENIKDMHNHRLTKLYAHGPAIFAAGIRQALKILPKKLSKRVTVVGKMSDLDQYVSEQSPEEPNAIFDWYAESDKAYNETVQNLKL